MKGRKKLPRRGGRKVSGLSQLARGMPALDGVQEVTNFVSPQNVKYKILKTNEMDAYDPEKTGKPRRTRSDTKETQK
jgi:hypothetical protein